MSTIPTTSPEKKSQVGKDTREENEAEGSGKGDVEIPNSPEGIIDLEVFLQIRDMDDEDDDDDDEDGDGHSFSRSIVYDFFEQAEATFIQMEDAIAEESLPKLSALGHFLKGSSAALGIIKVQGSCEKMQHYGNQHDEEAGVELEADEALKRIKGLLKDCRRDYEVAKGWMTRLYEEGVGL